MSQDTRTDEDATFEPGLFPIHPKWFKIGFYVFLLVWLVFILLETLTYTQFEDVFFPYVVGIPIGLLLVLQLLIIRYPEIRERALPGQATAIEEEDEFQRRMEEATKSSGRPKAERERYELVMIGWIVVLPFMMYFIGMGWTLILYVFAFTWYFVRDVRTATVVTAIVVAFVYLLFIRILDMIVWRGRLNLVDPLDFLSSLL